MNLSQPMDNKRVGSSGGGYLWKWSRYEKENTVLAVSEGSSGYYPLYNMLIPLI